MEAQFATRNITQQKTWFHYVIAALDPKVAAEVHSLVLHPPEDALYDKLRSELIKRTKASEQRRLQELLTAEELGNRKLTQLLWHMQQLLGDSGPALDSSFVCELLLQHLPSNVRLVLASSSSGPTLTQLAEMADRIVEVLTPAAISQVTSSPAMDEMRQLTDTLSHLVATLETSYTVSQHSRDQSQSSHPSSYSSSMNRLSCSSRPSTHICWHHRKFGSNARKCQPPCNLSGNEQASG